MTKCSRPKTIPPKSERKGNKPTNRPRYHSSSLGNSKSYKQENDPQSHSNSHERIGTSMVPEQSAQLIKMHPNNYKEYRGYTRIQNADPIWSNFIKYFH